jgi:hypothetical protein
MRKRILSIAVVCAIPFLSRTQILINEIQTSNISSFADEDGDYKDWFELYHAGDQPLNLEGWALTDRADEPQKWPLPGLTLNPGQHVLIWASGKNRGSVQEYFETPIFADDNWFYLVPSSEPDASWRLPGFDNAGWNTGPGGFGYGDGDDGTDIGNTSVVFMRKSFDLNNLNQVSDVILHMDYDDSFVAYLNGIEIARVNLSNPGVPPLFSDLSSGDHEANGYQGYPVDAFPIDPLVWVDAFNEGENVLAIQVHNTNAFSSDLTGRAWLTLGFTAGQGQFESAPAWMGFENQEELHTNFSLTTGETLLLTDDEGNTADQIVIPPASVGHSFARLGSGGASWCITTSPTPGTLNDVFNCATGYEPKPLFDIGSGMYNSAQTVSLSSDSPTAVIRYTTDGSVPNETSELYIEPLTLETTVTLSARCFSTGALLPSMVEKNTYLIDESYLTIPVICISTNPENLWDENSGIYVLGPPDYGGYPYFGSNFWEDWERESYIEYFDTTGALAFEGPIGLKIHGGWSRALDQKSFRVMVRDDYGMDQIDYPLIPDKAFIQSYKSFNLRNGGNEYWASRYHDALMQRSMKPTDADYMGYSPVVTFLNGEYWGMYELRENLNEDYCESNHGVPADQATVISYNYMGFNVVNGSDDSFFGMLDFVTNTDPQDPAFLPALSTMLDLENYADYIIAETYYGNGDWSNGYVNNTKFWHDDQPGGKWRFLLMDLDFGLGGDPCSNFIEIAQNDLWIYTDLLFSRVIQNPQFRYFFIQRYLDLRNSVFRTERLQAIRDTMRAELEGAMPRHCERWGSDYGYWYYSYDYRLDWNNARNECIVNVLQDHFGLGNTVAITLDVQPPGSGRIHINTIEPSEAEYPWQGTYFNGLPVRLTAVANPGYTFDHWAPNSIFPADLHLDQFILNVEEEEFFTAHFTGEPSDSTLLITEFMYNADNDFESGDWIELYNPLSIPVDLSGMYFKDEGYFNRYDIPLNTVLDPGEYLILAQDPALFASQYPDVTNVLGPWSFSLSNSEDEILLFNTWTLHHGLFRVMEPEEHSSTTPRKLNKIIRTTGFRVVSVDRPGRRMIRIADWFQPMTCR